MNIRTRTKALTIWMLASRPPVNSFNFIGEAAFQLHLRTNVWFVILYFIRLGCVT